MAVNTGDGKWLVPVVNGNLPDGIQIKAPENYSVNLNLIWISISKKKD